MRRAAVAAACSLLLVLAACSDDESTEPTTSPSTSRLTEITGPVPAPSVTVPVVTQPVPGATTLPSTVPAPTAAPTTAAPATTAVPVPGCDGGTLFAVLGAATELPAGSGAEPPRCVGDWATMVVGAPGVDRALAVFFLRRGAWTLANFGSDAVCTGAQVPAELYSDLGCALWETG